MSRFYPKGFYPTYYNSFWTENWHKCFFDCMLEIIPDNLSNKERGVPYWDNELNSMVLEIQPQFSRSYNPTHKFDCDSFYRPHMLKIDHRKALRGFFKLYILCLSYIKSRRDHRNRIKFAAKKY